MTGSGSCKVQVSCQINPSEDPSKVETAILNIFPDLEISISDKLLIGKSNGMNTLSNISESIRSKNTKNIYPVSYTHLTLPTILLV